MGVFLIMIFLGGAYPRRSLFGGESLLKDLRQLIFVRLGKVGTYISSQYSLQL